MEFDNRFGLQSFHFFMERLRSASFEPVLISDASVYLSAMRDRYEEQSKGGGEWQELAARTVKDRARQGFGPRRPILVRKHILADGLNPGKPGFARESEPERLRVGYGGGAIHDGYADREPKGLESSAKETIANIARYHQQGTSKMPARPILVEPDQDTLNAMQIDALTSFGKIVEFIAVQSI